MVGIPRPSNFYRASGSIDSTAIIDDSVGAVDVANTLVYDMDNKAAVVGADLVLIADSEASNINKEASLTAVGELLAGTVATSSLENTTGVLKVDIKNTTATAEAAAADYVLTAVAATGVNQATTITNLSKVTGQVFAATNATSALSEVNGAGRVNIGAVTTKAAPVGADMLLIEDTVAPDANVNKMCTITNLAETLAGTVTASGIENTTGALSIVPASLTAIDAIAVADTLIVADATAANAAKAGTVTMLADTLAGAAAATGMIDATGTVKISPTDAAIAVGADSLVFMTAAGVPQKDLVSDVASAMAGTMLNAAAGVLSHEATGQMGVGTIRFGATGDCTSVTIGVVTYPYDGSPTVADGEWDYGASASESATNLAAAINGKTSSPYSATANTDTVHVYANAVGTAGNVTITRQDGAQPATLENTVGGLAAATKQWCMVKHTVTANDVDTAILVNIPLPFTPTMFTTFTTTAAGVPVAVTGAWTIGTAPARIVLTGGANVIATDIITVTAHE